MAAMKRAAEQQDHNLKTLNEQIAGLKHEVVKLQAEREKQLEVAAEQFGRGQADPRQIFGNRDERRRILVRRRRVHQHGAAAIVVQSAYLSAGQRCTAARRLVVEDGKEGLLLKAIGKLLDRVEKGGIDEVVLATNATLEGQTTAHYIAERLEGFPVRITQLAHGLPVGGELDYLDEGTLAQALRARRPV